MLVALRVRQADAEKCSEKLLSMNGRMKRAPGFLNLDVIRRDGGLGTDFYVLACSESQQSMENWRVSSERHELLDDIEQMAISDVSRQYTAGCNIWFQPITSLPSAPKPPLFWKRWVVSMLAVYPALIFLVYLLAPFTRNLPQALGLLVVATILTGLTTAFIVPFLTQRLGFWLTRQ